MAAACRQPHELTPWGLFLTDVQCALRIFALIGGLWVVRRIVVRVAAPPSRRRGVDLAAERLALYAVKRLVSRRDAGAEVALTLLIEERAWLCRVMTA